eukprot:394624-Prymnesium_polylepis.1
MRVSPRRRLSKHGAHCPTLARRPSPRPARAPRPHASLASLRSRLASATCFAAACAASRASRSRNCLRASNAAAMSTAQQVHSSAGQPMKARGGGASPPPASLSGM